MGDGRSQLTGVAIEDAWSAGFTRLFGRYVERRLRRCFHAVRLTPESRGALEALRTHAGPVLVAMNHASWWDPLVAVLLHRRHFPDRRNLSPMDARELGRFRLLRKLGIFGIDPDEAASLQAMGAHVRARLAAHPHSSVIVTPQGRFTDVRVPVVPRPGAASLLAAHPDMAAWSVAIEYGFWIDARPEIFVRVLPVSAPADRRMTSWQRALTLAMESNRLALADLVQARDPSRFADVLQAGPARVHPVYDLWLRWTRRGTAIDLSARGGGRP